MNRIRTATTAVILAACMQGPALAQTTIELDQDGNPFLSIPLDETQPVTIDPETGELRATAASGFSCSTGGCEDVQVSFASGDGGFFLVDGNTSTSVPETGSVTFDWGARGAWECQGTGMPGTTWNNPGKLPFGPFSVSVSNLDPGNYQAGLTCSNGAGNVASATPVQVNVQESTVQIPPGCEGRQPATAEASPLCEVNRNGFISTTNCFAYASVFGDEFPGNTGQGINIGQSRDTYFTMEFSTAGLTESNGLWIFESPQVSPTTTGPKLMTISECPGDFDQQEIESEMGPNCYLRTGGFNPSLNWKRAGTSGAKCELDLNKTYYFNMMYTTDPAGTPPSQLDWDCQSSPVATGCGNIMAPSASN